MITTAAIPTQAALNFYSKTSQKPLTAVAAIYAALASLSIACLRSIPFINRGLPAVQELPQQITLGRVAIVTGSNTGIGLETSKGLVERGYEVVLACRSKEKALQAIEQIRKELPDNVPGKAVYQGTLDLSSFQSVHNFSDRIKAKYDKIDLLINNAGRNTSGKSEKGLDLCFQTNFLGHFVLTENLMELLLKATKPRVINLSSVMHHYCKTEQHDEAYWKQNAFYGPISEENGYSASKLAAILFTVELNKRYQAKGLRSIAVSPGTVNSDIWRGYPRWVVKIFAQVYLTVRQGAYTSIAASVVDNLPQDVLYLQPYHQVTPKSAAFPVFEMLGPFVGYQAIPPRLPKDGSNGELTASALWKVSEELTKVA